MTRDEWAVGKVICGGAAGVGSSKNEAAVGGALKRAAGDRFKWEAWKAFVWVAGATLAGKGATLAGKGAVCSLGMGGGEVTTGGGGGGGDFRWGELGR